MATTAIWDIKGRLDQLVNYAKNPAKTEGYSGGELQGLSDVMDYATQDRKTEKKLYVSGLNCDPVIARDQMITTKRRFLKEDGIMAYHAYQSFAKGETTPDIAHEIGKKLAQEVWGGQFEVIVATHLDKGHLHNHFVINSVSFFDGKKYNDCNATYRLMRQTSDRLCKEYGLSIVENPERGRSKHYAEWKAEQEEKPTWRGLIRADVDDAIRRSVTFTKFTQTLREMGYEVKTNVAHIAVRPQDKERFVRLRSLGDGYTEDAIWQRILLQRKPERPPRTAPPTFTKTRYKGIFTLKKITWKGLRALYFHYVYLLRKARRTPPDEAIFLLREDLRQMNAISAQAKFLAKQGIERSEQLTDHQVGVESEITRLIAVRKALSNEKRSAGDEYGKAALAERISELSRKLRILRSELAMCGAILERSVIIREKLELMKQTKHEKELKENEFIGRSRPDREFRD
jgi:hypothetical protein